jgi:hypothetical protein
MLKANTGTFKWFIALVVISLILYALVSDSIIKEKIRKNHTITCGKILSIREGAKGKIFIEYEYKCNEKYRRISTECKNITSENYKNGINNVLIAVEKNNCRIHILLEEESDFLELDIKPVDTLGISCKD